MKELFMVIVYNQDGDSYKIFLDSDDAHLEYEKEVKYAMVDAVGLVKVEPGTTFGYGARGEFYGGEVIKFKEI